MVPNASDIGRLCSGKSSSIARFPLALIGSNTGERPPSANYPQQWVGGYLLSIKYDTRVRTTRVMTKQLPVSIHRSSGHSCTQKPDNYGFLAPDKPISQPRFADRSVLWISAALLGGMLFSSIGCQFAASSQNAQGTRLYEQGQYSAALQEFQKVISSDPQNPDGYYNLAATTHRLGTLRKDPELVERAESLYNQCLDHDPNHVECYRGLAVLLVDSGRPDRAFALLKNWASKNPNFAEPRVELARLYEESGEPQTALKYLEDAVNQNANNSRAWLALASLRERSGDLTQALQNYQRANAINGAQPNVTERIAALSRQLNSNAAAATYAQGLQGQGFQNGSQIASPQAGSTTRY